MFSFGSRREGHNVRFFCDQRDPSFAPAFWLIGAVPAPRACSSQASFQPDFVFDYYGFSIEA
ncbi:MAG: hypothetical protein DME61_00550, partial [Verrucomicrobia bacterium]